MVTTSSQSNPNSSILSNPNTDDSAIITQTDAIKLEGNTFFKSKNYESAISKFTEGILLAKSH